MTAFSSWLRELDYGLILPLIAKFPFAIAHRLAAFRGTAAYWLRGPARFSAIKNAASVFPKWPPHKIQEMVRRQAQMLSQDEMESFWFDLPLERLEARVQIQNLTLLEQAARSQKGVILWTGHLGTTGLVITVLGKKGFPLNCAFRHVETIPGMPKFWYRYAKKRVALLEKACGRPILYTGGKQVFGMRSCLRAGEILILGLDVVPGFLKRTQKVQFLGESAQFPDGILRLYEQTGAKVLFWANRVRKDWICQVEIEDLTPQLEQKGSRVDQLQFLVDRFESAIEMDPAQWLMWEALHHFRQIPQG